MFNQLMRGPTKMAPSTKMHHKVTSTSRSLLDNVSRELQRTESESLFAEKNRKKIKSQVPIVSP